MFSTDVAFATLEAVELSEQGCDEDASVEYVDATFIALNGIFALDGKVAVSRRRRCRRCECGFWYRVSLFLMWSIHVSTLVGVLQR